MEKIKYSNTSKVLIKGSDTRERFVIIVIIILTIVISTELEP